MANTGIRMRLVGLVAIFCIVIAVVSGAGIYSVIGAKDRLKSVRDDRIVALVQLSAVLDDTLLIRRHFDRAERQGDSAELMAQLDGIDKLIGQRRTSWNDYRRTYLTAEEIALADTAQHQATALDRACFRVMAAYRSGGQDAGLLAVRREGLDDLFDAFHEGVTSLMRFQAQVANDEFLSVQRAYEQFRLFAGVAILLGILLGGLASRRLIRSITVPLQRAMDVAGRIAEGDFDTKIPTSDVTDIARLLGSLAEMRTRLRSMSERINAQVRQLRDMSNALPLAVFQMRIHADNRREYVFVSDGALDVLGVSPQELQAHAALRWRYEHPDDTAHAQALLGQMLDRVRAGETNASCEAVTRMQIGGETRILLATAAAAYPLPDGSIIVNGYYQDITRQRRSQQLLQDIIDECPSLISVKDVSGRYLLRNRAVAELFGGDLEQVIGRTDFEIFEHDVARHFRWMDGVSLSASAPQHFEYEVPVRGVVTTFAVTKFRLVDESGTPYGICTIADDVSERRQAERALRENEAYRKALFDKSHVAMVVADPVTWAFIDCNMAAARIFGFATIGEALDRNAVAVSPPLPWEGEASCDGLADPSVAKHDERQSQSFEWRHQRPDGDIWDAIVRATQISYRGEPLLLVTFEDITVQKRAEMAIREAKDAAEEAARAKADFLATMTHEIRTPLTSILGHLELLRLTSLSDQQRSRLAVVDTSSRILLELVDGVLDFSKIESGNFEHESIPFDLIELVESISAMLAPTAQAKGLTFECAEAADFPRNYVGDPVRIRQIIVNLASNAIKFTQSGAVTIDMRTGLSPSGEEVVEIGISDTGVGIPTALHEQLFEPFKQADSSITRRFGGTGLGLALSRRLAQLMRGEISLSSTPGVGSRFVLALPLQRCMGTGVAKEFADEHVASLLSTTTALGRRIRILVVEDHPFIRALFAELLEALGYSAEFAEDGAEALEVFRKERFDLVFTDLSMPTVDGYELARRLRLQGATVPIILITAHADADERVASEHIDGVLLKPFTVRDIDAMVRSHVG